MNPPKVSVCVVTYNHARYIRDCLTSVLSQSEDVSLEILVGDDLSEDETGEIVRSLAEKHPSIIRYFRHRERKGPLGNYQFLIQEAHGDYIAHLDGDDLWLPGKLRRQIAFLEEKKNLVAVFSNAIVIDDNYTLKGGFNKFIPESFDLGFLLQKGNFICHASLVYRANVKQIILNIPIPCIDYQIHIQLAQKGNLGYLNSALVAYRVASATSMSVLQNAHVRDLYWQALLSVNDSQKTRKDLSSAMAHFLFISSWDLLCSCQPLKVYYLWKKVLTAVSTSKSLFIFSIFCFFFDHLKFKFGNLITKKLLRRPLKTYFLR